VAAETSKFGDGDHHRSVAVQTVHNDSLIGRPPSAIDSCGGPGRRFCLHMPTLASTSPTHSNSDGTIATPRNDDRAFPALML
jgi:hypothetical protein